MSGKDLPVPSENLDRLIYEIRGQKVMLDADLAEVYGVLTRNLNKAVKRNCDRFPDDFAFLLTPEETANLMFQIGTSSPQHGGRRKPAWVFTEHGAITIGWGWQGKSAFLDMIELQVDRGTGFQLLAYDTTPGYVDSEPIPATPAKWKYRAIYRVGEGRIGQWSAEAAVVVGG